MQTLQRKLDALFAESSIEFLSCPVGSKATEINKSRARPFTLRAMSMHAAGDSLPEGRFADETLDVNNFMEFFHVSDRADVHNYWSWINAVSLQAYWDLFGRDTAIGHALF